MTNNMDMGYKNGLMGLNIKDTSMKASKKVMAHLFGQMVANIKANLKITIFKDLAIMSGLMGDNTKGLGGITKCMAEEYLYGLMAENTKDNTSMIRNKDSGSLAGPTEDVIKASGRMGNKTVREPTEIKTMFRRMAHG